MTATDPPRLRPVTGSLTPPAVVAIVTLVCAVSFLAAFPLRTDYAGHFLAGAGGTAVLLGALIALGPTPWRVVATTAIAVLLGVGTEATVFKIAIFDPVDLGNQSLGALVVACGLVGSRRSAVVAAVTIAGGLVALTAGFWFAFA